jgi:hypothetical protein
MFEISSSILFVSYKWQQNPGTAQLEALIGATTWTTAPMRFVRTWHPLPGVQSPTRQHQLLYSNLVYFGQPFPDLKYMQGGNAFLVSGRWLAKLDRCLQTLLVCWLVQLVHGFPILHLEVKATLELSFSTMKRPTLRQWKCSRCSSN